MAQSEGVDEHDIPDPTEEPLEAAYLKLHHVRDKMSSDLYDEREEVRDWAGDVEWAYTAISEHEDINTDRLFSDG